MRIFQNFIKLESSGAILLFLATICALGVSNSPWHRYYDYIFSDKSIILNHKILVVNLRFIINEILMTLFFLVVGLEIKYELLCGSLNTKAKALLPTIAALGGM